MNRGTSMNILKQLGMTADGYNLVNTVYYVSLYIKVESGKMYSVG